MKKFKVIVRNYETKQKTKFTKITAKGDYIPDGDCLLGKYYTIRICNNPSFKLPTKEGIYTLVVEDAWLDKREGFIEKNIVRVKPIRIIFEKDLIKDTTTSEE